MPNPPLALATGLNTPIASASASADQVVMAAEAALAPEDQGPLIVEDDGQFHVSDSSLSEGLYYLRRSSSPTIFEKPSGGTLRLPQDDDETMNRVGPDDIISLTTGLAYRVRANQNNSYFESSVALPCGTATKEQDPQDAEVYTGGTSPNGTADIGLEFNAFTPAPRALLPVRNIEPFFTVTNRVPRADPSPFADANAQIACDQTVLMRFYPVMVNLSSGARPALFLGIQGQTSLGRKLGIMQLVQPSSGWSPKCACATKYVTSLATDNQNDNFFGSYFGLLNPTGSAPKPLVHWSSVRMAFAAGTPKTSFQGSTSYIVPPSLPQSQIPCAFALSGGPADLTVGLRETCAAFSVH